ncbi:MAG: hypothetical protein ACJASQ_004178 [Crocinitomicaceae bacterium]|jgi:hypothetical protein
MKPLLLSNNSKSHQALGVQSNVKNFLFTCALTVCLIVLNFDAHTQISYDSYSTEHKAELVRIDSHINALRVKIEWVLSVPEEKKSAEASGWFTTIRNTMDELSEEKRIIIREETNKEFISIEEFADLSILDQKKVIDEGNSIVEMIKNE